MRRILVLTCLCLFSTTAGGLAQGTLLFNNKAAAVTPPIDAPISYPAGTPFGGASGAKIDGALHPTAMAGLYAGPDGATEAQLVLVGAVVGFRSGVAAGYVNVGAFGSRTLPFVSAQTYVIAQIRAWDSTDGTIFNSYEAAATSPSAFLGKSNLIRVLTGGDVGSYSPPLVPTPLFGLSGFSVVPEPGIWQLGILGVGSMLMIRKTRRPNTPHL
jgi:hypothetical protein